MTAITGSVKDVTGVEDNETPWSFASVIRFADDGSVITEKPREVRAVSGTLKVNLVPGYAIVTYGKHVWQVTVPETPTTLKALIEAGVAFPPDTAQALLDAAVGQYVETHREQFRTRAVPVVGDPLMVQWVDENGAEIGDPVPWSQVIPEAIAQEAVNNAAVALGVQPQLEAIKDAPGRVALILTQTTVNPVNHLRLTNAATGASVGMSVDGSDPNAGLTIAGKGTGRVSVTNLSATSPRLSTAILDGNGNAFLGISGPASAVNYLNISNRQTGSSPFVQAVGTDANIDITIWPKGTGNIRPYADTGNDVKLTASGADTNHNFTFTSKGSGVVNINDGRGGIAKFIGQASPFNSFELSNGANGVAPMVAAVGTNTNIHLALKPKGTGTIQVVADTGLTPAVQATGVDANISLSLRSKGTSPVVLANSSGAPSFAADMVTNQVNYLFAQPAAAGSGVTLTAAGSDTSIDLNIAGKGGGRIKLNGSSAADVTLSAGVSSVVVSGSGGTTISRDNTGVITLARVTSAGLTAANDVQVGFIVDPTINQPTGGVSGYRMISANPTETAVGTGERSLLWLGVGGSRRFSVDSDGVVRHRAFTTAGRPSASSVPAGSMIWNSTTKKPNYSDGTNWYDAAGVAA